jgi:hypothetical protein
LTEKVIALALAACCFAAPIEGASRSHAAIAAFKRQQPCPGTGRASGPCSGWTIDHIEPLCAGGADDPSNMQWQTTAEAKVKDKQEWARCRAMKKQ